MAPFRVFTNWDKRTSDLEEQIEPYRKYYFLCEGENTERWYFQNLIDDQKLLKLSPSIDVCFLEKTGDDLHVSTPKRLLDFANQLKNELDDFDKDYDKIVIVFDVDIYKDNYDELDCLIKSMENYGHVVALTNPSFELFLLLHIEGLLNNIIFPNEKDIIDNQKIGQKRYIEKLLSKVTGINPKSNEKIGKLCKSLNIAIKQEKKVNQNIYDCRNKITSNIASIIEMISMEHKQ